MELTSFLQQHRFRWHVAPANIELPHGLVSAFLDMQAKSEDEGVEYGCNLFLRDGDLRLGDEVRGTKERTPLDTARVRTEHEYIGDFHVHPYTQRLHIDATIGPSITDLEEIVTKRPEHSSIGLYFVFAGHLLHLIVIHDATREWDQVSENDRAKISIDMDTMTRFRDDRGAFQRTHPFNRNMPEFVPETDSGYSKSLAKEREAFSSFPSYHLAFSNANLTMNRQFAAVFNYDYYIGDLESEDNQTRLSTRDGLITLVKQPRPIWPATARDSSSTGLICHLCGRVHSRRGSTVFGRWHRCRTCLTIYCTYCGDNLSRPVYLTRERRCTRKGCGGRTELLD